MCLCHRFMGSRDLTEKITRRKEGRVGGGGRGWFSPKKKILLRAKNFFLLQSTGRRGYYCANYTEILVSSSSYPS